MNSSSARIGYARVSTADQNLDAQTAALQAAGCTMVRTETGDGTTLAGRPELEPVTVSILGPNGPNVHIWTS